MLHIGCHLSSSAGFAAMGRTALSIGADTFQFFTRNPRGSRAKAIDPADAQALMDLMARHHFAPLIAHAPYTLNPCSAAEDTRQFALQTMADDLRRMEYIPGQYYNFHPGSHVGQGMETGITLIADTLNAILTPEMTTTVLLETMSGKGSEIGSKFEELKDIFDALGDFYGKKKLGVCLDLCHMYCSGYDIVNDLDGVLQKFDSLIGIDRIKAVHLNDTANPFASKRDRHARIGEGFIGVDAVRRIMRHDILKDLPFFLETPHYDVMEFKEEILLVK